MAPMMPKGEAFELASAYFVLLLKTSEHFLCNYILLCTLNFRHQGSYSVTLELPFVSNGSHSVVPPNHLSYDQTRGSGKPPSGSHDAET